jgi:hypothetical protein
VVLVRALGGLRELAVLFEEAEVGVAEGDEAGERRRARAERRGTADQLVLQRRFALGDHRAPPIEARGTLTEPHVTFGDVEKIGLELEVGLTWNAPLPKGGFALANEVKLQVSLELARA